MTRIVLSILMIATLTLAVSCASAPDGAIASEQGAPEESAAVVMASQNMEPATQPALPPGHPPIDAMQAPATQPALPAGHPDISGMMQQPAQPQLPSGHPDINSMTQQQQPAPSQSDTLTVRAEQGTIGGPAISAGDEVKVEVVDRDRVIATFDAKLNEQGVATIENVPTGATIQPVITVTHAGVAYQAAGRPGQAEVAVKVYETTDQPVGWEVRMRHIMLQPTAQGVQVMDMLDIDNATDRAYLGESRPDGSRVTFEIPLPAGVKEIQMLAGFHDCCTKFENGKLVNTMAIIPGRTQYQLAYLVPATNQTAQIETSAPATTKHLIIFAPDDGTTITGEGLESGKTNMGSGDVRYFKAAAVPAGQPIRLTVSGTPKADAPAARSSNSSGSSGMNGAQVAKTVAAAGGLLIFLIGGAMLFRRSTRAI